MNNKIDNISVPILLAGAISGVISIWQLLKLVYCEVHQLTFADGVATILWISCVYSAYFLGKTHGVSKQTEEAQDGQTESEKA